MPTILPNSLKVPIDKQTTPIINHSFLFPKFIPRVPFVNCGNKIGNIPPTLPTSLREHTVQYCQHMPAAVQQVPRMGHSLKAQIAAHAQNQPTRDCKCNP